jgi:hypothetical protein
MTQRHVGMVESEFLTARELAAWLKVKLQQFGAGLVRGSRVYGRGGCAGMNVSLCEHGSSSGTKGGQDEKCATR